MFRVDEEKIHEDLEVKGTTTLFRAKAVVRFEYFEMHFLGRVVAHIFGTETEIGAKPRARMASGWRLYHQHEAATS